MPVAFRGVTLIAPGVASYIDDSQAMAPVTTAPTAMAVVGVAERGEPSVAVAFRDASTAYAYYGTGTDNAPLVDGIVRALAAGAGTVYGVRVGAAKAFEVELLRDGGSQSSLTVTSKEWGRLVKMWNLEVLDASKVATLPGGKRLILTTHEGAERQYSVDNIYKAYLTIASTSSTFSGSCLVSDTSVTLTKNDILSVKTGSTGNLTVGTTYKIKTLGDTTQFVWNRLAKNTVNAGSLSTGTEYYITDLGTASDLGSAFSAIGWTGTTPAVGDSFTAGTNGSEATGATFIAKTTFAVGSSFTAKSDGSIDSTIGGDVPGTVLSTGNISEYLFADYPRLGNLIAAVDADGMFTIELARGATSSLFTRYLDASATESTIPAATSGAIPLTLTANTRAVYEKLNSGVLGALVSVEWNNNYKIANAEYRFKYFDTQGIDRSSDNSVIDPAISDTSWRAAFAALRDVDVSVVTPMTGDDIYLAEGFEHVKAMSEPDYSSERILVAGGPLSQSKADALSLADSFNHKRVVICWPGIYDYDRNGDLQLFAPYYLAAQVGGVLTSQPDPSIPLTNKNISVPALEFLPSRTDVDELLTGGVMTLRNDTQRGILVPQSLTTWTGDLAYAKREISTVRAADRTVRAVRQELRTYIGQKASRQTLGQIGQAVRETLQFCTAQGWIADDPNNPSAFPAYNNIVIRPVGDAFYVDFTISPVRPMNYITITALVN